MEKELGERFNDEVERYRRALLYYARKCDWETFKTRAGSLFDYVEVIELSEIERKFFRIFRAVLVMLVAVLVAIANIDVSIHPALLRIRYTVIVLAVAGSCFELYFFLNFRMFMEAKSTLYKKRKDRFIRNIEQDFRGIITSKPCTG